MVKLALIGLGGAIGSILRYLASSMDFKYSYGIFPISTFLVNLLGSFVIGFLWGLCEMAPVSVNIRVFLFVGILGGFTTFSSFALENFNLLKDGEGYIAVLYILLSNCGGIFLVYFGYALSKLVVAIGK